MIRNEIAGLTKRPRKAVQRFGFIVICVAFLAAAIVFALQALNTSPVSLEWSRSCSSEVYFFMPGPEDSVLAVLPGGKAELLAGSDGHTVARYDLGEFSPQGYLPDASLVATSPAYKGVLSLYGRDGQMQRQIKLGTDAQGIQAAPVGSAASLAVSGFDYTIGLDSELRIVWRLNIEPPYTNFAGYGFARLPLPDGNFLLNRVYDPQEVLPRTLDLAVLRELPGLRAHLRPSDLIVSPTGKVIDTCPALQADLLDSQAQVGGRCILHCSNGSYCGDCYREWLSELKFDGDDFKLDRLSPDMEINAGYAFLPDGSLACVALDSSTMKDELAIRAPDGAFSRRQLSTQPTALYADANNRVWLLTEEHRNLPAWTQYCQPWFINLAKRYHTGDVWLLRSYDSRGKQLGSLAAPELGGIYSRRPERIGSHYVAVRDGRICSWRCR